MSVISTTVPKGHDQSVTQRHFGAAMKPSAVARTHLGEFQSLGDILKDPRYKGSFTDVSTVPSYAEMHQRMATIMQDFEMLPSALRERFAHSPGKLLDFLADPKNDQEAIRLGLKEVRQPPAETELDVLKSMRDAVTKPNGVDGDSDDKPASKPGKKAAG